MGIVGPMLPCPCPVLGPVDGGPARYPSVLSGGHPRVSPTSPVCNGTPSPGTLRFVADKRTPDTGFVAEHEFRWATSSF